MLNKFRVRWFWWSFQWQLFLYQIQDWRLRD